MLKKILIATVLGAAASTQAAVINLNAGDAAGTSSFNAAGNWLPAGAPTAGNEYVAGYIGGADRLLRTPVSASSFTFAGDKLTIAGTNDSAVGNRALLFKGTGTAAVITINNLVLDGGQLRHGNGDTDQFTVAGNINITANGGGIAAQGPTVIQAAISGSGLLKILDNGSGGATRTVTFASPSNTFSGNIQMTGTNAARSRLTYADDAVANFVIGANGVNNNIAGTGTLIVNGDFNIDLSGAVAAAGNAWNLVTVAAPTYGSTFNVIGFTPDAGGSLWTKSVGLATYTFNEADSKLTVVVPEPTTLAAFAAGSLLAIRRRK